MIDRVLSVWPIEHWIGKKVVVAVSGGPDSMMLMDWICRTASCNARLLVVHCNHGLRGLESDEDARFVEAECRKRELACQVVRLDPKETVGSSEDTLRKARYRVLKRTALEFQAEWIALGHNADDNLETFLHRLMRGTGLRGLAGIPAIRRLEFGDRDIETDKPLSIVRPLLRLTRQEISSWLENHAIPFRVDSSNQSSHYTRNRIRHELVPVIDRIAGEGWRSRMEATLETLQESQSEFERQAADFLQRYASSIDAQAAISIPLQPYLMLGWPTQREALVLLWHRNRWPLRELNQLHWKRIRSLLSKAGQTTHPCRMDLPGSIQIEIRKGVFTVRVNSSRRSEQPND